MNFTRKATVDFVDWVDDTVRMGLSHFRTLKQQPDAKLPRSGTSGQLCTLYGMLT